MPAISYRPRYTVSDYEQWEGDWELWDGVPVSMSPSANYGHMKLSQAVSFAFAKELEKKGNDCGDCQVLYEIDWRINDYTVFRPDVIVTCHSEPPSKGWITQAPAIVAEILSASTAERDHKEKKRVYASEGVLHYLILDPDTQELEHFELVNGSYAQTIGDPLILRPHEECELSIPLSSIFH